MSADAVGPEGLDPRLFSELATLEAGNFWFRGRNRVIVWALSRWFPHLRSFLEVGCGTGFVLSAIADAFPTAELTATDLYEEALTFARARVPRAGFLPADARSLPPLPVVDVVGVFDVLEHIDDDRAAIASIFRRLVPGGGLVVTVPQHPTLWSPFDEASSHIRRYRVGELDRKLEDAGFSIVQSTSFVALLAPGLLLSRATKGRRPCSVADELRRTQRFDWLLELVMRLELALIRRGVSFPVGGSRLVVAMRP